MALTPEQRSVIKRSLAVARRKGASPRERKALVQTLLVESGARDLSYGDRDSEGALQQRPSQGWGPASEPLEKDVEQFLAAAGKANTGKGSAGQLAQRVQRSGFPDRYDQRSGDAEGILKRFGGKGEGTRAKASSSTQTTPGVDRSEQRKQVKLAYLAQRGRPGSLLELKAGLDENADTPSETTRRSVRTPGRSTPSKGAGKGLAVVSDLDREAARLGIPVTAKQEPGHATGGDHDPAVKGATARDYGGSEAQRHAQYKRWLKRYGLSEKDYPFGGRDVNATKGGVRVQIITRPHGTGPHNHIGLRDVA